MTGSTVPSPVSTSWSTARPARSATRRTEVEGTRRLTVAGGTGRRPHLLYVSIVGVDRNPLPYYKAKLAAEAVIEAAELPHTILRATQFHSLLDGLLGRLARLPVLPVPRGVRFQPIDAGEVATRVVALVGAGPSGRAPDMGGPEVRGIDELARAWLRARGRSRRIVAFPIAGRAGVRVQGWRQPLPRPQGRNRHLGRLAHPTSVSTKGSTSRTRPAWSGRA